jgi:hypothetical protein
VIAGTDMSGEPALDVLESGVPLSQTQAPAVIVNDDRDMVGIVEGGGRAGEDGFVVAPFGRTEPPDQPGEIAAVPVIAAPAALGREVELIPPLQLRLRRQRLHAGALTADQVAAHRHKPGHTLWPQGRDDAGAAGAPVESRQHRAPNAERVQQLSYVPRQRRGLGVAERGGGPEASWAETAQIGDDHAAAGGGEQRRHVDEAVHVIRPAVQEQDGGACLGPDLHIGDVERPCGSAPDVREGRGGRELSDHVRRQQRRSGELGAGHCTGRSGQELSAIHERAPGHEVHLGGTAAGRIGRKAARSSRANNCGCSHAAKCPPRPTSLK